MAIPFNGQITVDYSAFQVVLENSVSREGAKQFVDEMEGKTKDLLKFIGGSATGLALYSAIAATRRRLRITHAQRSQHAEAKPLSWKDATAVGKKAKDPTPGDGHDPTKGVKGTGLGSDTEIQYSPTIWAASSSTCNPDQVCGAGFAQDEVLFHEVFHGMRMMAGVFLAAPMGDKFSTEEEFVAILVTNIFSAETSRAMRANHEDVAELKDRNAYVRKYGARIAAFKQQQPQFADALSKVKPKTGFNPLA